MAGIAYYVYVGRENLVTRTILKILVESSGPWGNCQHRQYITLVNFLLIVFLCAIVVPDYGVKSVLQSHKAVLLGLCPSTTLENVTKWLEIT
jgi:hypothetical protein